MTIEELNNLLINIFIREGIAVKLYDESGINAFNKDSLLVRLPNNTSILAISPFKDYYTEFSITDTEENIRVKVADLKHAILVKFFDAFEFDTLTVNMNIIPFMFYNSVVKLLNKTQSCAVCEEGIFIGNADSRLYSFNMTPCREILDLLVK